MSARDIAVVMTRASGSTYRTLRTGSVGSLGLLIRLARLAGPEKPNAVDPTWQRLQYALDMFSGAVQFEPLDNDRYPGFRWTSLRAGFTSGHLPGGTSERPTVPPPDSTSPPLRKANP